MGKREEIVHEASAVFIIILVQLQQFTKDLDVDEVIQLTKLRAQFRNILLMHSARLSPFCKHPISFAKTKFDSPYFRRYHAVSARFPTLYDGDGADAGVRFS